MVKHTLCPANNLPLTLAESLCVTCAGGTFGKMNQALTTPTQRLTKAWRLAELAVARGDIAFARSAFAEVNSMTDSLAKPGDVSFKIRSGAIALRGALPSLFDRVNRQPISEQSQAHANRAYGAIIVDRFNVHMGVNDGVTAEAFAAYVMSRPGMDPLGFLSPSSPREESGPVKRENHDVYQLWHNGAEQTKYPLSLKKRRAQGGSYDIPSISVAAVMQPVLKAAGADSLSDLFGMAALESSAGGSSAYQETVLDFAGHCLKAVIETAMYETIIASVPR